MPSGTSGDPYDEDMTIEQDLIEADDGLSPGIFHYYASDQIQTLDANDPISLTSDRTPLTGNIQSQPSSSSRAPLSQSYLTSSIPGEDRRAPQNTIDESVWETVSRDLFAIWEKMKQVLWPKYLLGGMLQRGGGIAGAERGEAGRFGNDIREIVGR